MTTIVLTTIADLPQMKIEGREIKAYLKEIMLAAQASMAKGMAASRGGRLYTEELRSRIGSRGYFRPIFAIGPRGSAHIASAPGAYPAVDTGRLRTQTTNPGAIDVSGASPRWRALWGTPTPYAKWLAPADESGVASGPGRGFPSGKRKFMRGAVEDVINDVPIPEGLVKFIG